MSTTPPAEPDPHAPETPPIRLSYVSAVRTSLTMLVLTAITGACPVSIFGGARFMDEHGVPLALFLLCPALILALLAAFGDLRRQLHRQRRARGWCVGCGYDLRGSPPAARCPECGRAYRKRTAA